MSVDLRKVRWLDGDLISEKHFYSFESWVETLVMMTAHNPMTFGLLSVDSTKSSFINNPDRNIIFTWKNDTTLIVTLDNWYAITRERKLISIQDSHEFELKITKEHQESDEYYNLFILPIETKDLRKLNIESNNGIEDTPLLYLPYGLNVSDPKNEGICICRFKIRKKEVTLDSTFIPVGVDLNSSQLIKKSHQSIIATVESLRDRLRDFLERGTEGRDKEPVREFATNLFRNLSWQIFRWSDRNQNVRQFFISFQQFFDYLSAEFEILKISDGDMPQDYKDQVSKTLESIKKPFMSREFHQELTVSPEFHSIEVRFQEIEDVLKNILKDLPGKDFLLRIKDTQFKKFDGGFNKLVLHFDREYELRPEDSLVLELSAYSDQPPQPTQREIRVTVKDTPFGRLRSHDNHFEIFGTDDNNFRINCPARLLESDIFKTLTIYLPSPLGEQIDSEEHQEYIVCKLVKSVVSDK